LANLTSLESFVLPTEAETETEESTQEVEQDAKAKLRAAVLDNFTAWLSSLSQYEGSGKRGTPKDSS
jgi:hypothetical protein